MPGHSGLRLSAPRGSVWDPPLSACGSVPSFIHLGVLGEVAGGQCRVLSGLLAVNLNSPGYYIHWGFIQLSLANFIVILLMIVVFVVALFAPFPGGRNRQ